MTFSVSSTADWIRGSITALVTPFHHGAVAYDTYRDLIDRQIKGGTHGIVPVGTTGETSTLNEEEHVEVIRCAVSAADGRIPVIAGVGSNDTATSIMLAEKAQSAGADALLAVTGYYNKPSQDGLIAHFTALADSTDLPIILYNVPGRTACDIAVSTMKVLARHPGIVGVKDATGNLARVAQQRLACGSDFIQLSGEDATAVGFNAMGGTGCISVTSNVVPDLCALMQTATLEGRWEEARELQDRLTPLAEALFMDTSPGPTKYALARLGLCQEELRLPLVPASEKAKIAVAKALEGLGLID
ncbi:4-hydroxy-tetrahydrodipicolinate synthase [Parvularcula marina]|uniref:4-hydroxy-tetrahydrodipicolinate synthase n=1 Tax=Parvularcula marina TaxID=2292771 RepID=A0A371R8F4_9PROT|nr:4-hydroxy-tetrahydrodipicolinate synthase [Parvularcula marina]RFB01737.1 4-hydroxy-tetrahydrodipicolinate synthase [Parvularcula marina]